MAGQADLRPSQVAERYFARFRDAGGFDRRIFDVNVNVELMHRAFERGRPVTRRDFDGVHRTLYKRPLGKEPPWSGALER